MASPSYSTDLVTLAYADGVGAGGDTSGGTWDEMGGHTGGGAETADTDYFIYGSVCITQAVAGKTGTQAGLEYAHTGNVTINTGEVVFMWQVMLAGNAMDTFYNGGMRMYIGEDQDWNGWKTGGSDFARNPYGGWQNVVVDPTHPPDYVEGTPPGTYQWFCSLPNMVNAVSKGNVHGVDVLRVGRGTLEVSGGDGSGYATFIGMAAANDDQNARWGLFQEQAGIYLWKGVMALGVHSGYGPVDFRDENRNITVDVVVRTYPTFNKIEVNNASSRVDWTNINVSSLPPCGYYSPGDLVVVDNADVNFDGCVFTDMGTFDFLSNSTIENTTFRRCEQVYWGQGTFDGCTFDTTRASAAIYTEDLTDIDNCTFTGGNEGNNGIHMAASGTYTFVGNTFTGYGASGSPSAAIYHDSGGHLTINVQGGDSPSVYDVGTSTSEVNNPVILTLTGLVSGSEVRVFEAGTTTELYGVESSGTTFDYPYTFAAGTYVDIVIHHVDYVYQRIETFELQSTSGTIPISQEFDRWYSNP
jgi:hypothetical protein